jgi:hypothetical protein
MEKPWVFVAAVFVIVVVIPWKYVVFAQSVQIGSEVAIPVHLQDGQEFTTPLPQLLQYGAQLFNAKFTVQVLR